ncbi:S8 family serine peptidase [Aureisphaera galaxeae]|uniref:S8 family serine peptidase n=1 Tax=Aureisphaera galaxeae TaxID=1538023 RepID=UPI0023504A97|nr:S8 family serine peptidase [Aureisphaera galaxeae]MDC8004680.1 S8 family serine peptidase [Aureisphaera galaxeae]
MKNLLYSLALLFATSCSVESPELSIVESSNLTLQTNQKAPNVNPPTFAPNKLVVKFWDNTPIIKKIEARDRFEILSFRTCDCAEESIELWTLDMSNGSLEGQLGEIVSDPDLEGAEFLYYVNTTSMLFNNQNSNLDAQLQLIKPNNSGVTIAIIDSGLDYTYKSFARPFLYNKRMEKPCPKNPMRDYSGWDFVNNDNNIYDDNGHGTVITDIIYKSLTQAGTNFQVLPIKAFDSNGEANYFDILCAFQYAATNPDVDIINMSFGWYLQPFTILSDFMLEASDKNIISSAGNAGIDTEDVPHFPSSYEFGNMTTVAAMNEEITDLYQWSNYGLLSIDLAAPGENILFYMGAGDYLSVDGTSFSNGYVTARAAQLYTDGITPQALKQAVVSSGDGHPSLINKVVHPVVIDFP